MKKLDFFNSLLFVSLLFLIIACNKDEEKPEETICLLTREVEHLHSGSDLISNFIYDESNNLIRIEFNENNSAFATCKYDSYGRINLRSYYTDDDIIRRIKYSYETNSVEVVQEYIDEDGNWVGERIFNCEYSANDQLTKITGFANVNGTGYSYEYIELFEWLDGNIISAEYIDITNDNQFYFIFEYDDKYNAYTSIKQSYFHPESKHSFTKNNIVRCIETDSDGNPIHEVDVYTKVYEYNDKNFPKKSTSLYSGVFTPIEYSFEYNCD